MLSSRIYETTASHLFLSMHDLRKLLELLGRVSGREIAPESIGSFDRTLRREHWRLHQFYLAIKQIWGLRIIEKAFLCNIDVLERLII